MISNASVRAQISRVIEGIVNAVVSDHYDSLTQEPPLTARVGQKLEDVKIGRLEDAQPTLAEIGPFKLNP